MRRQRADLLRLQAVAIGQTRNLNTGIMRQIVNPAPIGDIAVNLVFFVERQRGDDAGRIFDRFFAMQRPATGQFGGLLVPFGDLAFAASRIFIQRNFIFFNQLRLA